MQIQSFWFGQNSVVGKGMLFIGIILFISLVFNGCGASRAVKMYQAEMKETYELQKPVLIRTSDDDNRPKWTHNTVFEKSGKVYFTGRFVNGSDYAVTIRCANAEALKNAVQAISLYIRAEFSEYVQGSNAADGQPELNAMSKMESRHLQKIFMFKESSKFKSILHIAPPLVSLEGPSYTQVRTESFFPRCFGWKSPVGGSYRYSFSL